MRRISRFVFRRQQFNKTRRQPGAAADAHTHQGPNPLLGRHSPPRPRVAADLSSLPKSPLFYCQHNKTQRRAAVPVLHFQKICSTLDFLLPGSGHRLLSGQRARKARPSVATVRARPSKRCRLKLCSNFFRLDCVAAIYPANGVKKLPSPSRAAGRELNYPDC